MINLIGNAVKFTSTGSVEVRVRLTRGDTRIRVEVADTGPGIEPRHASRMFQAFERLNLQATSGNEGAGLGLAITARLVQLMHGHIGHADNPGGGSIFWLEMAARKPAGLEEVTALAPAPLSEDHPLRVLVADDQSLNRSIASGFLTRAGHNVVCVDSGVAAVEAAAAEDFDVILMDVRMPGMNGLDATRRIRALPPPRGTVAVVAVTAQAFTEQILLCQQAGMDGHVSKPFTPKMLLTAIAATSAPATAAANAAANRAEPPAASSPDHEPPVFDQATFDDITDVLPATEIREQMRTLMHRSETFLRRLRNTEAAAVAGELVDDVHNLAGGAGTFGFLSAAAAARRFEGAVDTAAADKEVLAKHLADAIEASIVAIRQVIASSSALAP